MEFFFSDALTCTCQAESTKSCFNQKKKKQGADEFVWYFPRRPQLFGNTSDLMRLNNRNTEAMNQKKDTREIDKSIKKKRKCSGVNRH